MPLTQPSLFESREIYRFTDEEDRSLIQLEQMFSGGRTDVFRRPRSDAGRMVAFQGGLPESARKNPSPPGKEKTPCPLKPLSRN